MKVLALCTMGLVRSHAMKVALMFRGHEVINVGVEAVSPSTLDMLSNWAELILTAEQHQIQYIDPEYRYKAINIDLGPDVWRTHVDKNLLKATQKAIKKALKTRDLTYLQGQSQVSKSELVRRLAEKHGIQVVDIPLRDKEPEEIQGVSNE